MKLRNSTDWPDQLLRRMVSWCCRQIDLPPSRVRAAQFTKTTLHGRGRAWTSMRILVRIGTGGSWPWTHQYRKGAPSITYADAVELLVALTAHELWHLNQYIHGWDTNEAQNERIALQALTAFRANRDALWAEWSEAQPARLQPKPSAVDRRAAKAAADLERWTRKLKLASTKVRKLRKRVRYYERTIAARAEGGGG